ncbi:MAG: hypothetical protein WD696_11565 [Bryobacteraceae bacterium]
MPWLRYSVYVMEIDSQLAEQAMRHGLNRFPEFADFGPRLVCRQLYQGAAYMLEYRQQPPGEMSDAWDFQNAVVKTYKSLAGIR